ncbi:MAG: hypothetical protein JNM86_01505 [Phycisphaerae bacterium]|nr:hypothetical protein [Phycisphaerae bacterium]MBN8598920.1 hypothetical protein [Planctomycetota bacterium]
MASPAAVLLVRTILFTVWSALLVIAGLAALGGPVTGAWIRTHGFWLGFAALCAGQFVFMAAVADRWFPYADRRLVALAEGGVLVGLLVSVGGFVRGLL